MIVAMIVASFRIIAPMNRSSLIFVLLVLVLR